MPTLDYQILWGYHSELNKINKDAGSGLQIDR